MTVLNDRTGLEVDWSKDLDPTMMCRWDQRSIYGQVVRGSLRTIAHYEDLDRKALRRFGVHFTIIQPPYNTGVPASAGTHDYDCCVDWYLPGVDWWTSQRWGRFNGLWGWHRFPPKFSLHNHGFTAPALINGRVPDQFATRVGIYVPGQLYDFKNHAFGLSGQHTPGSDKSWFPKNLAASVFDLGRFIEKKREENMEYKDWSAASKKEFAADVAKALLEAPLNRGTDGEAAFKDKTVRWALKEAAGRGGPKQ